MQRYFLSILAISGFLLAGLIPVKAAVSEWVSVHGGAVRLIASGPPENGMYRAGLEFSLEPGWHTYWRSPGESGIPPSIQISAPANLASSAVLFPAPKRYDDGFSSSIVYEDAVVLPLEITPDSIRKPIELSVTVFFGICKDICVPADAALTLQLSPEAKPDKLATMLIERDRALVPGSENDEAPSIERVEAETTAKGHHLVISALVSPTDQVDLFAEGPDGSYIALPKLEERAGTHAVWSLSTRGLARTDTGSSLTFVLIDGTRSIESRFEVPAEMLSPEK
ncbi:protein-disulfide reductase DsbD domain-containing protein [Roseibium algae]|uniref:Protein-disulfide reductase DsbD domain-containing protein n=1 Tax=Roseibium algae TaxID=3123038 RepID=A0ABU8TH90_9HYPH